MRPCNPRPPPRRGCENAERADTNVGLFKSAGPQGLEKAGPSRLARSVLRFCGLALPLNLGLSMLFLSGCILPLAPEFHDPPPPANYAPQISSAQPPQGSIVTAIGASMTFEITVKDLNVSADLWIRWIGEYPPYSVNSRPLTDDVMISHSATGDPVRQPTSVTVNCLFLAPLTQHPITALVSDRAFLPRDTPDAGLETLLTASSAPAEAQNTEANWVLNLDCTQ
jgi:hypothetical protein